jgi:outer membrane protein assembly factor BamA
MEIESGHDAKIVHRMSVLYLAKVRKTVIHTIFLLSLLSVGIKAQETVCLDIEGVGEEELRSALPGFEPCQELSRIEAYLENVILTLRGQGFLEASVDDLDLGEKPKAILHLGKPYSCSKINVADSIGAILDRGKLKAFAFKGSGPFGIVASIRAHLEDLGYLEAELDYAVRPVKEYSYDLDLRITLGSQFVKRDIVARGEDLISDGFLRSYLNWKEGEAFSMSELPRIQRRLTNLPYLRSSEMPTIGLEYDLVNLVLALEKRRSNVFDFILGVLPASQDQDRGVIFSVYLNTVLHNTLKQGEMLAIKFINTKPNTQELNVDFDLPYISSWPFGVDAGLQIYRDEEAHFDIKSRLGFRYLSDKDWNVRLYWERYASNVLNPDTSFLVRNGRLPDDLDFETQRVGFDLSLDKRDNVLTPRKGWVVSVGLSGGLKQVDQNERLTELESEELPVQALYDSLGAEQYQVEIKLDASKFFLLEKRMTLLARIRGKALFGEGGFLENELYRLGGRQDLRGFDEQFFSLNRYVMTTIEARFFLDEVSYFSAFWDSGYLYRNTTNQIREDWVQGIGLGIHFQTGVGLFNLNYGLGFGQRYPFDISAGKIHFGYVSLF